jgi:hypothetical protein
VEQLLRENNLGASPDNRAEYRFLTASDEAYREHLMRKAASYSPQTA